MDKPVISYSEQEKMWIGSDGRIACQDHAHVEPCPYNHKIETITDQ